MKTLAFAALLALGLAAPVFAQSAPAPGCVVDPEIIALPACAFAQEHGRLRVGAAHGAALAFNRHGLAAAHLTGVGWTYVDRHGWVVVRDVAVFDNGASGFHHGLVRVTRGGKWGLADTRGRLAVPMRYNGMLEYDPRTGWAACEGCRVEKDQGGEHSWFAGGRWLRLNARGKRVGPMQAPGAMRERAALPR
jgi:hypothetical protein